MAENDVLKSEIEVTHRGETFVFTIPSISDEMRIAGRARAIRAASDPSHDGSEYGLPDEVIIAVRAAATFEVVLKQTSASWVHSSGPNGPVVDHTKFPLNKIQDVATVFLLFQEKLNSFRDSGAVD